MFDCCIPIQQKNTTLSPWLVSTFSTEPSAQPSPKPRSSLLQSPSPGWTQMRTMVLEYESQHLPKQSPSFVAKYTIHGAYGIVETCWNMLKDVERCWNHELYELMVAERFKLQPYNSSNYTCATVAHHLSNVLGVRYLSFSFMFIVLLGTVVVDPLSLLVWANQYLVAHPT